MTMRATVERDQATATDQWGQPVKPDFAVIATLPCYAWSKQRRELIDADRSAVLEDIRAVFPKDADLNEQDRIAKIENRRGDVIFAGPLVVTSVVRRAERHKKVMLERAK